MKTVIINYDYGYVRYQFLINIANVIAFIYLKSIIELPGWKSGMQDFHSPAAGLDPENFKGGENLPEKNQDQGLRLQMLALVLQWFRLLAELLK
jgi:hypothetical protein